MANVLMQLMLDIRQLQGALRQATASMQQATTRMSRQAQRAGREMQAAGKKATGFGNAIDFIKTRIIGAGLFFAGFYQGLILFRQFVGEVVAEFFNLDDALRRVQSITKESDESIHRLRNELLASARAGKLFDQTASDVADSMFTIAQAGFSTSDSLILAKLAAEGAAVGFTTAEVSAKVLVNVLKAYDLPVSRAREVMDILFQTVDTGIVTFEDLSNNLGRVLASASALEVPLTDITGTVATLTLRGFTAAQAMTSVNRILQTFIRPSNRAKEAAAELGIELNRDTIAAKGLVPMLNEMWIAAGKDANVFAEMFDRIQSTRGALSLMSDDGVLMTRVMEDMGIATADAGAMALAMEQRAKSLKFQMSILRSQFLAVATEGLTPLTGAIAGVVQQINGILAGQNAFFNFFSDLDVLVQAVILTFLFMKRTAIAAMFIGIAQSLQGLVTMARVSALEVGVLGAAVRGLLGLVKTLAPLLIFLAVIALNKLVGQMKKSWDTTKATEEHFEGLEAALRRIRDLAEKGILTPEQVRAKTVEEEVSSLADVITDKYGPAIRDIVNEWGGFKAALVDTFELFTKFDTSNQFEQKLKEFEGLINRDVEALIAMGATSDDLEDMADQLERAARAAAHQGDEEVGILYKNAAGNIREMSSALADSEAKMKDLIGEGEGLQSVFAETETTAKDVKSAIEAWVKPIQEAKALTEEILGLTTEQDIVYRALIEPVEDRIADRNVQIADAKLKQFEIAEAMNKPLEDIEEGESAIFDSIEAGIGALEEQNEKDAAIIDTLETRLEREKELNETQAAANVLADLRNGKYDELTGELMPEQIRLLDQVVHEFLPRGGEGIRDWITLTEAMGQTLDEDVLQAILLIVDSLEKPELSIDVRQALVDLGLVTASVSRINELLRAGMGAAAAAEGFLPGLAGREHGVRNFMGGMALVGEAGPELVRLPRGVDVVPHGSIGQALRDQSRQPASNLTVSAEVNVTTSLLKDFLALKAQVVQAVEEQLDEAAAQAGLAKPRFGTFGAGIPRV